MMSDSNNTDYQSSDGAENTGTEEAPDFGGGDVAFVTEEGKKPLNRTTVVLFGLIVLGGAALYYMHLRTGPAAASAASNETANATIDQFLNGGESSVLQMQRMLRDTEKVIQQFLKYPTVPQIPLKDLQQNPFRQTAAKTGNENVSESEAKRRKEEERQQIVKAVQGLQLQSIMHSTGHNACMINNTLYQEGQQIDGFTIEKISANSVVVKNGTYRFELKMQR